MKWGDEASSGHSSESSTWRYVTRDIITLHALHRYHPIFPLMRREEGA
jgi:hypothetical protein